MAEYTHEQREQAAQVLEKFQQGVYGYVGKVDVALDTAIACLLSPGASPDVDGKAGGWLDTADIKPDRAHETIIVQDENGQVYTAPGWIVRDFPDTHPRWMHLPKSEESNNG